MPFLFHEKARHSSDPHVSFRMLLKLPLGVMRVRNRQWLIYYNSHAKSIFTIKRQRKRKNCNFCTLSRVSIMVIAGNGFRKSEMMQVQLSWIHPHSLASHQTMEIFHQGLFLLSSPHFLSEIAALKVFWSSSLGLWQKLEVLFQKRYTIMRILHTTSGSNFTP